MASTTTLYRTADWTTAESAHGPTLAHWLRQELAHVESLHDSYGESFARFLRRCESPAENVRGGDHFPSFWTVDKWLTHVELHPGQAPFGVWSADRHSGHERRAVAA